MGLIFGFAVAVVTLLVAGLMLLASGMSDSQYVVDTIRPKIVAALGIGMAVAAVLAFTHFHPIGW